MDSIESSNHHEFTLSRCNPAIFRSAMQYRHAPIAGFRCRKLGHAIAERRRLRIPMKWGTNSGACGAASERATLVTVMISEVPHLSQEFCK